MSNEEIHVFETDFQPAAQIALWAHATLPNTKKKKVKLYVIVGEGRAHDKLPLVRSFYDLITKEYSGRYSNVIIRQGFGSDQNFPVEVNNEMKRRTDGEILATYREIYAQNPGKVWMMKPPREAIQACIECPETVVYCHGGYDWTALKVTDPAVFVSLTSRYKAFYFYKSEDVIGKNNIHQLFYTPNEHTHIHHPILTFLSRNTILWTFQIVSELEYQASAALDKEARDRKLKVLKAVQVCGVHQFILNYVMMIYCAPPTKQVEFVKFDEESGEVFTPSEESKLFVFDPIGKELRRGDLVSSVMTLNNSFR